MSLLIYIFFKGFWFEFLTDIAQLISVGIIIFTYNKKYKMDFKLIKNNNTPFAFYLLCFTIGIANMGVVQNITAYLSSDILNLSTNIYIESEKTQTSIYWYISASFIGPIIEEFLFRFILIERTKKISGTSFALIVSSILFGLLHFENLQIIISSIIAGLIFGVVYIATKNIWCSIVAHSANNLIVSILDIMQDKNILIFNKPICYLKNGYLFMSNIIFIISTFLFSIAAILFYVYYNKTIKTKNVF